MWHSGNRPFSECQAHRHSGKANRAAHISSRGPFTPAGPIKNPKPITPHTPRPAPPPSEVAAAAPLSHPCRTPPSPRRFAAATLSDPRRAPPPPLRSAAALHSTTAGGLRDGARPPRRRAASTYLHDGGRPPRWRQRAASTTAGCHDGGRPPLRRAATTAGGLHSVDGLHSNGGLHSLPDGSDLHSLLRAAASFSECGDIY
jgi:hypothetical protein